MKKVLTCFFAIMLIMCMSTVSLAKPDSTGTTINDVVFNEDEVSTPDANIDSLGNTAANFISIAITWLMETTNDVAISIVNTISGGASKYAHITLENIIFNKINAFNISYDTGALSSKDNIASFKNHVVGWFYTTRNISFAFMACFLVYIVIKLLTSSDISLSKYKEALGNWLVSFVLLFIIHYGIIFLISITQDIIKLIAPNAVNGFEVVIFEDLLIKIQNAQTLSVIIYCILFVFLVIYRFKFIFKYFKRQVVVGVLIVLAPFVCALYCIDKLRGASPSLKKWFEMLITNVCTQLIQTVVFVVVLYSAVNLIIAVPIFSLVFFFSLERCEKTVKDLFNIGELE